MCYTNVYKGLYMDKYKKELAIETAKYSPSHEMHKAGMSNKEINDTMRLWDDAARKTKGMGPNYDYGASTRGLDLRGHGGDEGKLPNHPTFSNESIYADSNIGLGGGSWTIGKDEIGTFTQSRRQIANGNTRKLQWMMDNNKNDRDIYLDANGNPLKAKFR
jgi:hypothetical protein